MRYLRLTCLILIGFMASGCATAWVVAEARKPGEMDIYAWVDNEPEDATVVWKRKLALPARIVGPYRGTTGITRKIVFEPEAGSPCEKFEVCFDCYAPLKDPCAVSVTYQELEEAGTYGFIVWTTDGPVRQFPTTGNPSVWLLLPFSVATDAAVVGAVLFVGLFVVVGMSGVGPPGG